MADIIGDNIDEFADKVTEAKLKQLLNSSKLIPVDNVQFTRSDNSPWHHIQYICLPGDNKTPIPAWVVCKHCHSTVFRTHSKLTPTGSRKNNGYSHVGFEVSRACKHRAQACSSMLEHSRACSSMMQE